MDDLGWIQALEAAHGRVFHALIALGASPGDAADAVQDAFERALRQGRSLSRPEGWLFVVARRRWRLAQWRHRLFQPLPVSAAVAAPDTTDRLGVLAAIDTLPKRQREVIVMRYVLGLSQAETAEALGVAIGTVAATASQAARRLRALLEDS